MAGWLPAPCQGLAGQSARSSICGTRAGALCRCDTTNAGSDLRGVRAGSGMPAREGSEEVRWIALVIKAGATAGVGTDTISVRPARRSDWLQSSLRKG